ncbi:MAG: DUF1552 domain-containing protein [Deltaproteobacteria bacterium]|nr:DUF1552 domain-containing protein [Deltaproteobacteria bacterium]
MRYNKLSRRTFLRGMSAFGPVAVGLPMLHPMLDGNGTAMAMGGALPCRVGVWFFGNGLRPEHLFPEGVVEQVLAAGTPGTVKAWDPAGRQHTQPLADAGVASKVSLVTGTRPMAFPEQAHHDGKNAILTGSYEWFNGSEAQGYAGPRSPSFDQLAANWFEGQTPFKSLTLGVQEGYANNEPGNSGHFTSSVGPNQYLLPEYSPLAVFTRLFTDGAPPSQPGSPADEEAAARMLMARRSILDAVMGDIQTLEANLGTTDKICLDQHLTAIRQLEMRLANGAIPTTGSCEVPSSAPQDFPTLNGIQPLRDRSRAMSDVLALALACDMTRAFSYQFTVFQTAFNFGQEPAIGPEIAKTFPPDHDIGQIEFESFHEAAHFPEYQEAVRIVTNFTFTELAYLLQRLDEIPEGDGTVLSNCGIMATTEHTEPMSHSTESMPMVLAGTCSGRLRGGQWFHGNGDKVSKGGLTLLRAAGVEIERFGEPFPQAGEANDPSTTETFTALEA